MTYFSPPMNAYDPGKYRHVVELQENNGEGSYGTYGQKVDNWQSVSGSSAVRCSITTLSGLELIRARQLHHEATHQVELNYRNGVTTKQRFRWVDKESSTRLLHIRHVSNPEQFNLSLVAVCVEEGSVT